MYDEELEDITDELIGEDLEEYKKHQLKLILTSFNYLFANAHLLDEEKHFHEHFFLEGDFMYRSPRLWTYNLQNPQDGKIGTVESDCFGQIIDGRNRSLVSYIPPELLEICPELVYKGYVQKNDRTLVSPVVIRNPTFMITSNSNLLAPLSLIRYEQILTPSNVGLFSSFSQTDRENLEVSLSREMIKNSTHFM